MKKALLPILLLGLLLSPLAHAALALDGSNGSTGTLSTTTVTLTLTTTNSNDVIIVGESCNGQTVTSVTATGLTFTQRATAVAGNPDIEEWEAIASSPLSAVTITLTYGGTSAHYAAVAFGISGANTSTIWDSHAGLPVITATAADPTISTSNANDFILGIMRFSSPGTVTAGSGWTSIYNGTGSYFLVEYQIVSSAQTNLTVAVGTGSGGENGSIADAVIQAGSAGSCTHSAYTSGGTFAVPTASSTSVWLSTGTFGTTPCDGTGTTWWSSIGAWETQ